MFFDYVIALNFIFNKQRTKEYMIANGHTYYFDDILKQKYSTLLKSHIQMLIFIVGLLLCSILNQDVDPISTMRMVTIAIWIAADVFIINPIIILCVLPRPLISHMHKEEVGSKEQV